ncbi:hypothetical protein CUU66_22760 [Peribacillus deserti]|uniref:Uncharacterized protein n=1 Tax=Peribacillus deserti TaxID=673318 RepID=A0A2N5LZV8_9BACI|nr:hypothetical protein CUU66_22760 [Peribacillus deserti]
MSRRLFFLYSFRLSAALRKKTSRFGKQYISQKICPKQFHGQSDPEPLKSKGNKDQFLYASFFFPKGSFLKDCCFLISSVNLPYVKQVDWNVRCETPAGAAGNVRLQRLDPRVISQSVHGKENRFPRPACLMLD